MTLLLTRIRLCHSSPKRGREKKKEKKEEKINKCVMLYPDPERRNHQQVCDIQVLKDKTANEGVTSGLLKGEKKNAAVI